jgi:hypothetical protein
MSRRSSKQRAKPQGHAPAQSEPALDVEAEASIPGSEAPADESSDDAPVSAQDGPQDAPPPSEPASTDPESAASPEAVSDPAQQAAEPDAPVEPEPAAAEPSAAPWVVVRWTGSGRFAGTVGGVKVRQIILGGGTMSIPESALDEARTKGFEFVRPAK